VRVTGPESHRRHRGRCWQIAVCGYSAWLEAWPGRPARGTSAAGLTRRAWPGRIPWSPGPVAA